MKKYNITVNGTSYEVVVEEVDAGGSVSVPVVGTPTTHTVPKTTSTAPAVKKTPEVSGSITVTSPMPGTILDVKVSAGQSVKKGDTVCVLEAMKMENDVPAPADGVVSSVNVQKGATVGANDILITLA